MASQTLADQTLQTARKTVSTNPPSQTANGKLLPTSSNILKTQAAQAPLCPSMPV